MAGVRVDRHAVDRRIEAEHITCIARDDIHEHLLARDGHEGLRDQDALNVHTNALPRPRERIDPHPQRSLDVRGILFRNDAAKPNLVGYDVRVDAAFDEPDNKRRMPDAGDIRQDIGIRLSERREPGENDIRRFKRIDATLRLRSVS